jgi:pimeloyl-ACP methyl ester carboxylesterase
LFEEEKPAPYALSGGYRIMLDPLGQGDSDKPHTTEPYAADHRVLDALAVVDALGVNRTRFRGYSMGGSIGFDFGVQHPERLETLILGGTRPSQSAAEAMPNATFASLGGLNHIDAWVDSDLVLRHALAFLRETTRQLKTV